MKLTLDPETVDEFVLSGRYYNGVVANAQYFGGGMHIAPDASMEDGYFDVIVLGDLSLFEVIKGTPSIYSGAHLNRRDVHHYKARVIRADPVDGCEVFIDMDGERPGKLLNVYPDTWRSAGIRRSRIPRLM